MYKILKLTYGIKYASTKLIVTILDIYNYLENIQFNLVGNENLKHKYNQGLCFDLKKKTCFKPI